MDGLSGPASVIAVVSIALQLVDTLQKLTIFWKDVQDAPSEVESLFQDIENLHGILFEIRTRTTEEEFETLTRKAAQCCDRQVSKLYRKLLKSAEGLKSKHRLKRQWSAFKTTLEKPELDQLKTSIHHAISILLLVEIHSVKELIRGLTHLQQQTLVQIAGSSTYTTTTRLEIQLNNNTSHSLKEIMQLQHDSGKLGTNQISLPEEKISKSNVLLKDVKLSPEATTEIQLTLDPESPIQPSLSLALKYLYDPGPRWARLYSTPLGSLRARSRFNRVKRVQNDNCVSIERDVEYSLYPNFLMQAVGITKGFNLHANLTSGWKYTISPFNAVSSASPIFKYCREGKLEAVRTLLEIGQASVRDRDELGRTPLWVASEALQTHVAEFLLREGAEKNVCDFKNDISTVGAIRYSKEMDFKKKVAMISLFMKYYAEEYDTSQLGYLYGGLVIFYRPMKEMEMPQLERQSAIFEITKTIMNPVPRGDVAWLKALEVLLGFNYNRDALHLVLRRIDFIDYEAFNLTSALHSAIGGKLLWSDPISVEMIARREKSLHRNHDRKWGFPYMSTPTSIAIFQPGVFFEWLKVLRKLNINFEEFIREELGAKVSPLKDEGWTFESLKKVFETKFFPDSKEKLGEFFLECDRCPKQDWGNQNMVVDLYWRRYLQVVRLGVESPDIEIYFHPEKMPRLVEVKEGGQEGYKREGKVLERLPYGIVCATFECEDKVCLAKVFDGEIGENIFFPEYPYKPPVVKIVEDDCPTKSMPGAFMD